MGGLHLGLGMGLSSGGGASFALDLNFAASDTLDSRVTFTRASSATRFNSAGTLVTMTNDQPRFDYNPSTLAARGLLIEGARTNLALYSSDLTNAVWVKTNATTSLTATGVDGAANSATILTATAANATALQAITSGSAARITSTYIKRRTGSGVVEVTQDNGTLWTAVTVTADWTRVEVPSVTSTNPTVGIRIVTSGDEVDVGYFQHEVGAFVTSAIPTVAATVTRAADSASMTGTNFSDWYNQTEGTFVSEAEQPNPVSVQQTFSARDATEANYISLRTSGATNQSIVATASVNQAVFVVGAVPAGAYRRAIAYKVNDFAYCQQGGAVSSDVAGAVPTGVDRMTIGGNSNINGHVKRITFYNTRKTDAELQALTT